MTVTLGAAVYAFNLSGHTDDDKDESHSQSAPIAQAGQELPFLPITLREDLADTEEGIEDMSGNREGTTEGSIGEGADGNGEGNIGEGADGNGEGNIGEGASGNGEGNIGEGADGNGEGNIGEGADGNGEGNIDEGVNGTAGGRCNENGDGKAEGNIGGGTENNAEENAPNGYDYANPVPENDAVGDDYFDDAVFIGDSRTEGLLLNTGLTNAIEYTHKGLMVDAVFTKRVINKNGDKISVMDALRQTDFAKVYIMLGINETGWPYNDVFIKKYGEVIDEIKNINPNALIYIQEILPVTQTVSQTHDYVKNEKINEYNQLIRGMAEEKQIYYIDAGSAVADTNGCLPEAAATDGIHLKKDYCEKWLEYLKTHTVKG